MTVSGRPSSLKWGFQSYLATRSGPLLGLRIGDAFVTRCLSLHARHADLPNVVRVELNHIAGGVLDRSFSPAMTRRSRWGDVKRSLTRLLAHSRSRRVASIVSIALET